MSRNEKWMYDGEEIEKSKPSGGAYIKTTHMLTRKALKAMNALFSITKTMQVPIKIMFN